MGNTPVTDNVKQSLENDYEVPELVDKFRWAFFSAWQVEAQTNDRSPMPAVPAQNRLTGSFEPSASAQRSTTRRKQQVMFKEWSQARHD